MEKGNYILGLDIGTKSIGWSVVDLKTASPLKFKGRTMSGVVIIPEEGKDASKRRGFRSTRRRLVRRKNRISLLQNLLAPLVLEKDESFYERLRYSYLSKDDNQAEIDYCTLFDSTHKDFRRVYEKHPTIYHLRKELYEADYPIDPRLIYLALHHIIKYRGNFLYEGQKISIKNLRIETAIESLLESINVPEEEIEAVTVKVKDIALSNSKKADKAKDLSAELVKYAPEDGMIKPTDWAKVFSHLLFGYKKDLGKLFDGDKLDVSFSQDDIEEKLDLLDEDSYNIARAMLGFYLSFVLSQITAKATNTISESYINIYDTHKKQLATLKAILNDYLPEKKNDLLNGASGSYDAYRNEFSKNKDSFLKQIKNELEKLKKQGITDDRITGLLDDIEDDNFLLKPRNSNNGTIPNQFHVEELTKILELQSKYHPYLAEVKDKIISICKFRIPYSIGPLSVGVGNHWIEKFKIDEKIYPWNFEEVVDVDSSAKNFILRMINRCTFLKDEHVLPKSSLLYSEFLVLDALSNIYIDNNKLSSSLKLEIYNSLFKKKKTVSKKDLERWLNNNYPELKDKTISGMAEDKFTVSLSSYIDLTKILGRIDESNFDEAEKIIEYVTIFNDKKILTRMLKKELPSLTDSQLKKIEKLKCTGWGRFSKKLLTGIYVNDEAGVPFNLIDCMRTTAGENFMHILYKRGYHAKVVEINGKITLSNEEDIKDYIFDSYLSPKIKKVVWNTYKVIKEISHVMKSYPARIFVESNKGEGDKKIKTKSRYDTLIKLLKDNKELVQIKEELKNYSKDKKALNNDRLYLYFLQNAKCLYSGKPLDINSLDLYEVDHIVPKSYIYDDSLENKALVLQGENQRKKDSLLLDSAIIDKNKIRWEMLYTNGLMGNKKYNNLCRTEVDERELQRLVTKQIVDTSQINKAVIQIMKDIFAESNIFGVSYQLVHNVKERMNLPKIRELNDYHHAQDAYTIALVGNFVSSIFNNRRSEDLMNIYRSRLEELNKEGVTSTKNRYGIITEMFYNDIFRLQGYSVTKLLHDMFYKRHDFFVNFITDEQTGEFYNQTISKKGSGTVPKKNNMPINIYGGFSSRQYAYSVVVKGEKKEKETCKLISIPILVVELSKTKKNAIEEFVKANSDLVNPTIVKRYGKLRKYQKIECVEKGKVTPFYIISAGEQMNAKQIWFEEKYMKILNNLFNSGEYESDNDKHRYKELFIEYCNKIAKEYPHYAKVINELLAKADYFENISLVDKRKVITSLMTATKNDDDQIKEIVFDDKVKVNFSSRIRKTISVGKARFISSSITGLFTKVL